MSLTLTLNLPDETQALVEAAAAARHTSVGEVVMSFLVAGAQAEAAQRDEPGGKAAGKTITMAEKRRHLADLKGCISLPQDFDLKQFIESEKLEKHGQG